MPENVDKLMEKLTSREIVLLELLAEGMNISEISKYIA